MFTVTYIKNNYLMKQKLAFIDFKNVSPKYPPPSFSLTRPQDLKAAQTECRLEYAYT